jgi:HSP20 family protein
MSNRNFDLNNMRQSINRVMEDAFSFASGSALNVPVDIVEVEDQLIILTVPLLGIVPESLDISVSGEYLLIQGKTAPDNTYPESAYLRRERRYGDFQRKVQIPMPVKTDEARAELKNGVLKISLPKHENAQATVINVVSEEEQSKRQYTAPPAWDGTTGSGAAPSSASTEAPTSPPPPPETGDPQ